MFGSQAARNMFLKGVFGDNKGPLLPTNLYVALLREASDPSGTLGTEPGSAGDYARVAILNEDVSWLFTEPTGSTVKVANATQLRWPVASSVYTITDPLNQFAIYDNTSSGNCLLFGELTTPITVTGAGDVPVIDVGDLEVILSD